MTKLITTVQNDQLIVWLVCVMMSVLCERGSEEMVKVLIVRFNKEDGFSVTTETGEDFEEVLFEHWIYMEELTDGPIVGGFRKYERGVCFEEVCGDEGIRFQVIE